MTGLLKLDFLLKDNRFNLQNKPAGYLGAILIGMAFAAGWPPCIGPILGTILVYAGSTGSAAAGVKLLAMYSLGMALPFLFSAVAFNTFLGYSARIRKHMRVIMTTGGLLLVVFGLLLLTNKLSLLTSYLPFFEPIF